MLSYEGGLMGNLLIRHLPGDTIRMAKQLAARHHHSLQEEVSNMLIETIRFRAGGWSTEADVVRKRLSKKKELNTEKPWKISWHQKNKEHSYTFPASESAKISVFCGARHALTEAAIWPKF